MFIFVVSIETVGGTLGAWTCAVTTMAKFRSYIDGLMQERRNSSVLAMELRLSCTNPLIYHMGPGGRFKNTYELLNQRALKFSYVNKIHIFQCMGKIFCVEFQRYPLKFHTKYLTHTLKDMIFMQFWNFKSS